MLLYPLCSIILKLHPFRASFSIPHWNNVPPCLMWALLWYSFLQLLVCCHSINRIMAPFPIILFHSLCYVLLNHMGEVSVCVLRSLFYCFASVLNQLGLLPMCSFRCDGEAPAVTIFSAIDFWPMGSLLRPLPSPQSPCSTFSNPPGSVENGLGKLWALPLYLLLLLCEGFREKTSLTADWF